MRMIWGKRAGEKPLDGEEGVILLDYKIHDYLLFLAEGTPSPHILKLKCYTSNSVQALHERVSPCRHSYDLGK